MEIKPEYKNKKISINGIDYDFRSLSAEKLAKIHANNPALRKYFVEEITAEEEQWIAKFGEIEEDKFLPSDVKIAPELKEMGIDTPRKFEETIKKVAAKTPRKKK